MISLVSAGAKDDEVEATVGDEMAGEELLLIGDVSPDAVAAVLLTGLVVAVGNLSGSNLMMSHTFITLFSSNTSLSCNHLRRR